MLAPGLLWLARLSLAAGGISALAVVIDILRGHRQHMRIMNLVWPLTALYSGPLGLWFYFRVGRPSTHARMMEAQRQDQKPPSQTKPSWQTTAVGTTHCGSGCLLGDLVAEWFVVLVPVTLFGHRVFGTWLLDYIAAFAIGVAFQYFTIKPMRGLSVDEGLRAAIKADSASLSAWQVGMYGWMAVALFGLFTPELPKTSPVFWFMMQIAMLAGFATAFPVNRWLIRSGIKEAM
jgi:hypothetical protein